MRRQSPANPRETVRRKPIPILMYHRIVQAPLVESRHGVWVTSETFERQLRSLHNRGYSTITLQQYDHLLSEHHALPPRPIILTFDDGYEDNYTIAFPLLQRFGFNAVVFVVTAGDRRTNFWDPDEPQAPLLNRSQMSEMSDYGIEIGSHTVTHADMPSLSMQQLQHECTLSKETLQQMLGRSVNSFAYPYGKLTAQVKSVVAESGYTFGVATNSGPLAIDEDRFEIRRIQVFPWTNQFGFWKKTQSWYLKKKIPRHELPQDTQQQKAF